MLAPPWGLFSQLAASSASACTRERDGVTTVSDFRETVATS
jgi:hypothetical protein